MKDKGPALENPHEFATAAVRLLKQRLADELVNGIQYEKIDEWYELSQFEEEVEAFEQYLVEAPRSAYDYAITDSKVERNFVEGLESRDDVRVYTKLPNWFKVKTPIGEYNPDWAIVMEDRDEHGETTGEPRLYLVRETKSTHDREKLRPDERRKIDCGTKHFEDALDDVSYRVVTAASELP